MTESDDELRTLEQRLAGRLALPGSDDYRRATTPKNTSARQQPLAVVVAKNADDIAAAVAWAAEADLTVLAQATGHGAGRDIDRGTLMIHTAEVDAVEVDAPARTVRVGAGTTVGAVNAEAWRHGLLFPGGTAPDVAVTGYTSWGGIGWLTRPHGPASAALLAVDFVDGAGHRLRADSEHEQDVLWAYRGGGGVGVATALTFRLFPAEDLWAGYALWPAAQLAAVAAAWGAALPGLHPALSTSLGLLHAPDSPAVPEDLRGQPVVHLTAASVTGAEAGRSLLDVLAPLPPAAVQTFGPADAERLGTIHLDPPAPVPAVGLGRWLTAEAAAHVGDLLAAAGTDASGPIAEFELRWVSHTPTGVDGAETTVPGPLLLHATGPGPDPDARRRTEEALGVIATAAAPFDAGRGSAAFSDGQQRTADALGSDALRRLAEVRRRVDPHGRIGVSRTLG